MQLYYLDKSILKIVACLLEQSEANVKLNESTNQLKRQLISIQSKETLTNDAKTSFSRSVKQIGARTISVSNNNNNTRQDTTFKINNATTNAVLSPSSRFVTGRSHGFSFSKRNNRNISSLLEIRSMNEKGKENGIQAAMPNKFFPTQNNIDDKDRFRSTIIESPKYNKS